MSLAKLLKKGGLQRFATATPATPATVDRFNALSVATVATVAVANLQKRPANDSTPTPITAQDSTRSNLLTGWNVTVPTGTSTATLAKFRAASLALDAQIQADETLPGNDPDRWCYPTTTAMTGREIDLFAPRLARFTDKGVIQIDAEKLADKLVIRDREQDDRRLCLECTHLTGYGRTSWRCSNWQRAGVAIRARDNQLPVDLVLQLQRCDGLTHAFNPNTKVSQ